MFGVEADGIFADTFAIILVCAFSALYSLYTNDRPGLNCLFTGLAVYGILTLAENKLGQDATFTTPTGAGQSLPQQAVPSKASYHINPSSYDDIANSYIRLVAINNNEDREADRKSCPGSLPTINIDGSEQCFANGKITKLLGGLSSCRPHYFGFLGLGSYLSNSMEICPLNSDLGKKLEGQPVRVVKNFGTWPSSYYYSCLQVIINGSLQNLWAQTGSGSQKFSSINFFPGQPEIVPPLGGDASQICGR